MPPKVGTELTAASGPPKASWPESQSLAGERKEHRREGLQPGRLGQEGLAAPGLSWELFFSVLSMAETRETIPLT